MFSLSRFSHGTGKCGASQPARCRRGVLKLSSELEATKPNDLFLKVCETRLLKFPRCKLAYWNPMFSSSLLTEVNEVLFLNCGIRISKPYHTVLTRFSPLEVREAKGNTEDIGIESDTRSNEVLKMRSVLRLLCFDPQDTVFSGG